jgi:shikimate dehydrogenase
VTITGKARLYAIVGDPIAHVRVPTVYNARFAERGIDAVCVPLHVSAGGLADAIGGLRALGNLDGFVVTAPHKHRMVELCDEVAGEGRLVGAVNAVRREASGRLVGDLFDGQGFVAGLRASGYEPRGKRVFVVGAGGAASAVSFALARAGAAAITIHNRTAPRAEALAKRLHAAYPACDVRAGPNEPVGHELAVNATAAGLAPGDPLPFDVSGLPRTTVVAEVLMKPEKTALLEAAERHGCPIHFGRHMLDRQVDLMFDFFASRS